jgi:hypothetical protein
MRRLLFCFLLLTVSVHASTQVDVIVYGATPGGFCAAIAAAREGASVVVLEPTSHVGGVNTGGLCFSDSNQTVRSTVRGLFEEWHLRVEAEYRAQGVTLPYQVNVKDHTPWTYEPHVAAKVTGSMLEEAGVKVVTRAALRSATKDQGRILKLATDAGVFEAKLFVDGTYEGDLMAASGVSWKIGREGRAEFGESLAGKRFPKPKMRFSGLDPEGKPLPLVTTTDAGAASAGDDNVMVYSFRLCVTNKPANRVPFPEPSHYDPKRFEVVRRYFAHEGNPVLPWDLYPLPGGKFDANNGIGKQFSMGLVGACNGWSEADWTARAGIWEAHKQYTLEFYRFLTTDDSVPKQIRDEMRELGLCLDEFPGSEHWSPQLYVREGRRMVGEYVVSQADIMEHPQKADAIVVSSFPIDSHDCQRVGDAEFVVNEGTILPVRMPGRRHGYPYHIPYRAITPKASECVNLLVPVALSCTHVGMASIRVEPTWMTLGQSAGIAAALSARVGGAVQSLEYAALRERLLAQGQVLELPVLPALDGGKKLTKNIPNPLSGTVLDDADAELQGVWSHSANFKPHVGAGYIHDDRRGDGQSSAVFRLRVPHTGRYEVRMAYSAHQTRAKKVPLRIESGPHRVEWFVDQTEPIPAGEVFRSVGTVELHQDHETTITIQNAGTDGFVIVDALHLLPCP